jgi:hypothetical protein
MNQLTARLNQGTRGAAPSSGPLTGLKKGSSMPKAELKEAKDINV